jgi:membrane-bound metal-dependent hydrolase YbcI (DUF457 family)
MMTQTHVLVGLAMFGRPQESARNWMAIAGGIVPDAAIYALYAIEKSRGTSDSVIFDDIYFNSPFWQDAVAWGNSIPLWLCLLAIGIALAAKINFKTASTLLIVFAGSCLAHMACDFPLHVDDAHRHFFPLSSWRFRSPVSYWDPNHFGIQATSCEAILGVGLSIWAWMRFKNVFARVGIVLMLLSYLAVPAWFSIQFLNSAG